MKCEYHGGNKSTKKDQKHKYLVEQCELINIIQVSGKSKASQKNAF